MLLNLGEYDNNIESHQSYWDFTFHQKYFLFIFFVLLTSCPSVAIGGDASVFLKEQEPKSSEEENAAVDDPPASEEPSPQPAQNTNSFEDVEIGSDLALGVEEETLDDPDVEKLTEHHGNDADQTQSQGLEDDHAGKVGNGNHH